ncbi:MAG: hypothetical protein ACOYLO_00675 [Ferruginibacter sp.]
MEKAIYKIAKMFLTKNADDDVFNTTLEAGDNEDDEDMDDDGDDNEPLRESPISRFEDEDDDDEDEDDDDEDEDDEDEDEDEDDEDDEDDDDFSNKTNLEQTDILTKRHMRANPKELYDSKWENRKPMPSMQVSKRDYLDMESDDLEAEAEGEDDLLFDEKDPGEYMPR